jgi:hypothetical protein
MRSSRVRRLVAFEAQAVSGATISGSSREARVHGHLRVPLPEGALAISAVEDNVVDAQPVRAALRRLAEGLGLLGQDVCVVLPDGLARPMLLDVPRGVTIKDFGRYRVLPTLPFPPDEALVEVTRIDDEAVIATGVRRRVVEGYEAAIRDAGLRQDRLDLAPLAALEALRRDLPADGTSAALILGDVSVLIAASVAGRLRGLRTRLRDFSADEPARLFADVARTCLAAGGDPPAGVRVVGPGSRDLVTRWPGPGASAALGWDEPLVGGVFAAELAWIGAGA